MGTNEYTRTWIQHTSPDNHGGPKQVASTRSRLSFHSWATSTGWRWIILLRDVAGMVYACIYGTMKGKGWVLLGS
jgi:hypothetical protein